MQQAFLSLTFLINSLSNSCASMHTVVFIITAITEDNPLTFFQTFFHYVNQNAINLLGAFSDVIAAAFNKIKCLCIIILFKPMPVVDIQVLLRETDRHLSLGNTCGKIAGVRF